jgi:hypothetical protein
MWRQWNPTRPIDQRKYDDGGSVASPAFAPLLRHEIMVIVGRASVNTGNTTVSGQYSLIVTGEGGGTFEWVSLTTYVNQAMKRFQQKNNFHEKRNNNLLYSDLGKLTISDEHVSCVSKKQ